MSNPSHSSAAIERRPAPRAPGPPGGYFFGRLLDARRDRLDFFDRMLREHGDYVAVRFGWLQYIVVNDPEGARHILVDQNRKYVKSSNYQGLKLVLGEGLLTSEGDFWRRQRRLAMPAFQRGAIERYGDVMVDHARRLDRVVGAQRRGREPGVEAAGIVVLAAGHAERGRGRRSR